MSSVVAGFIGTYSAPSLSDNSDDKSVNSSIDAKVDVLYNHGSFMASEMPKCPRPYTIKENEKPEALKHFERIGVRYEGCLTNKYSIGLANKDDMYLILIGKIQEGSDSPIKVKVYSHKGNKSGIYSEQTNFRNH